jgi:hypothetical protein
VRCGCSGSQFFETSESAHLGDDPKHGEESDTECRGHVEGFQNAWWRRRGCIFAENKEAQVFAAKVAEVEAALECPHRQYS